MSVKEATKKLVSTPLARQGVFGFFWGLAHMVDTFRQPNRIEDISLESAVHILVFGLAVWLMMGPTKTERLALMAGANMIEVIIAMPIMPNHKMIGFMADTAILLSLTVYAFSKRREISNWFTDSEPFLRLALFVTYGSATIAKLNSGWFNTEYSCAVTMPAREFAFLDDLLGIQIPWSSMWFMPFVVGGAELLIWLLPLFAKTRPYVLVLAVGFHTMLSLTPVSQGLGFSFWLFALLVLYLPDNAHQEIFDRGKRFMAAVAKRDLVQFLAYGFLTICGYLLYISFLGYDETAGDLLGFTRWIPSLILLLFIGGVIALSSIKHRNAPQVKPPIAVPTVFHWALLAVVVFNSVAAYIGVKTYATMTMFSNLQMKNVYSNHLIIPRIPVDMMGDDKVTVLEVAYFGSSEQERFQVGRQRNQLLQNDGVDQFITWHELRREMSEIPFAAIVYERGGEVFALDRADEQPELVTLDPILHKLIGFRPITTNPECLW